VKDPDLVEGDLAFIIIIYFFRPTQTKYASDKSFTGPVWMVG
jgi:hypothetical protein